MAGKKSVSKRAPKKAAAKAAGGRKGKRTYGRWISKILKGASPKVRLTMSSSAARILNSFAVDMIDRLAVESAGLARSVKRRTLSSREVQAAVRMALPAELAKHSMAEATKAVARASTA